MRHSTTLKASRGSVSGGLGARRTLVLIAIALAAVWAAYGYGQEAYLSHKLAQQVSDLRRQNALIAAQNQGYHKDIQAITSGAANEEEARLNGYSRPPEKLYLVTATPTPAPASASPPARPTPASQTP